MQTEDTTEKEGQPEKTGAGESEAVHETRLSVVKELAPKIEALSLVSRGGNPPPSLENISLKLRTADGTEIEIPLSEISMGSSARQIPQERRQPASAARFASCGNCGERWELTGDPHEDHHNAMRHKTVCRTFTVMDNKLANETEYARLVAEHAAQPMQVEFRQRAEKQLAAAMEAERLQLAAPVRQIERKRPWWKFWMK